MASVKASLRRVHRYIALALAVLWVSQALTGLVMVFRWELSDAAVAGPDAALDVDALGARIAAINAGPTGQTVYQLYATGGKAGRFDLYVRDQADDADIVRIDGTGNVLRTLPYGRDYANGGVIQAAATLHQTLFAGDTGKLIIGLSGVFLLGSIVMGVVLAWPARARQWRSALLPQAAKPGAVRRYAWHRAAGLWLAVPAMVFITTGALMTIEHSLERWLGQDVTPPELSAAPALTESVIGPAQAIKIALGRFPSAELSGAALPSSDSPWYRIRVRQPQEWRRVYGTTVVYVAAADGRVLLEQDALRAPTARSFLSNLYPIHTGEVGGLPGRLVALSVGAWLLAMLVLGLGLWWKRRR